MSLRMIVAATILLCLASHGCDKTSASYGIRSVKTPAGTTLYFRRSVKGLNYDSLAIIESNDYCSEPKPDSNVVFTSQDHTVFYEFDDGSLHVFTTSAVAGPTILPATGTRVVITRLDNQEFREFTNDFSRRGLTLADVPIDETLWCFR